MPRCAVCVKRGLLCKYSPTENQNNKVIGRKLTDIEERPQAHEELYSIISGQDVRTVLRHLQDGDLLLQIALVPQTWHRYSFPLSPEMPHFLRGENNPYLKSRIYEMVNEDATASNPNAVLDAGTVGHEAQYRAPYNAAELIEPRIDILRPSQWTLVPASENLLRELLKMYLLHEYPTFAFFHKDHFLDDMAAGRENFCSSYLVNAVLAEHAYVEHAHTKAAHRTEFWNPQALQYQFLAEARRIRELEARRDSLTTIQALVTAITYSMNSMGEIVFSYIVQAISMGDRMKIFDAYPSTMDDKSKTARGLTAWGAFNFQALHYFNVVINLLEPFATVETQGLDPERVARDTANHVVADAKMRFETVSRQYFLRHGFETYDPLILQFHILLGFTTLGTISSGKERSPEATKALQSTLVLALKGLRDQANASYLAVTTFRLLKDMLKQGDTRLLQCLADVEQEKESVKALLQVM
ncbi:hypothetical protein DER46DRAFT_632504 [Fusarium sp. MPI-SDFR-AT-0072]|nr:hypothetical protein DER46DRAFT_632504 [Fusarium sp. MPI-SDFR-AT-0072]